MRFGLNRESIRTISNIFMSVLTDSKFRNSGFLYVLSYESIRYHSFTFENVGRYPQHTDVDPIVPTPNSDSIAEFLLFHRGYSRGLFK